MENDKNDSVSEVVTFWGYTNMFIIIVVVVIIIIIIIIIISAY